MVVEDQGELIRQLPERHHRPVICTWPAVHEYQRVPVSDDFDEEGHVSDRHRCPSPSPLSTERCHTSTPPFGYDERIGRRARRRPGSTAGWPSRHGTAPGESAPGRLDVG